MKKFEPSKDFVSRVMRRIFEYEENKRAMPRFSGTLFPTALLRYSMAGGGVLLGIINLIRLYYPVFSPVVCR